MNCPAYGFDVDWFDETGGALTRRYVATVYAPDRGPVEVSMYDPTSKRAFLKRTPVPGLALEDFSIGSEVTVMTRTLKVRGYADSSTEKALSVLHEGLCLCTTPAGFKQAGSILDGLANVGLRLAKLRIVNRGGPCLAIKASGDDADSRWDSLQGVIPPGSVQRVSLAELEELFDRGKYPTTASFSNCTLCLVRPHAVKEGGVGPVIAAIMEAGLEVAALDTLTLPRVMAVEMFDVYRGVVPYYMELIDSMSSGPSVAMEIRAADNACERLRELAGPHDVEIARHLRPTSLRATLGKNNAENGLHITDLPEDGELEVRYIFDMVLGK